MVDAKQHVYDTLNNALVMPVHYFLPAVRGRPALCQLTTRPRINSTRRQDGDEYLTSLAYAVTSGARAP